MEVSLHNSDFLLDDLTSRVLSIGAVLSFGSLESFGPLAVAVEDVVGKELSEVFIGICAGIVTDEACIARILPCTPPVAEGILLLILEGGEFVELRWVSALFVEGVCRLVEECADVVFAYVLTGYSAH